MQAHDYPGTFLVIEGADGSGTTTQSKRLAEELDAYYTAEPTEGDIGGKIERMISGGGYSAEAIALAFAADRMVHLEEEIIPRLEEGRTVVCDRYYHSSLVYQPALGADYSWVRGLNRAAWTPDLTVILDISSNEALSRIEKREHEVTEDTVPETEDNQSRLNFFIREEDNIFENLSFQEKVVLGYRRLADRLDEQVALVDSSQPMDDVFSDVMAALDSNLEGFQAPDS